MVFCSLLVTLFGVLARITRPLASMRLVVRAPSIWLTLAVSPTSAKTIAQMRAQDHDFEMRGAACGVHGVAHRTPREVRFAA